MRTITWILIFTLVLSVATGGISTRSGVHHQGVLVNSSSPSQTPSPLIITSNSEMASMSSSGVGTRSDPYILGAREIVADGTCIQIENTTAFFVLQGGNYGIEELSIYQSPVIMLKNVRHGTIMNSHTSGGEFGIYLQDTDDCKIINCITKDAIKGILLENADNCTVRDSREFHNEIGVSLLVTSNSSIVNNTIYANSQIGVELGFYSQDNEVYQNIIGWNDGRNAFDNGQNNNFTDKLRLGNLWSDYSGTGIYTVQGNSMSTDSHAGRLRDSIVPLVYYTESTIVDVESTDEYLSWRCIDEYPDTFTIYVNREIETQGFWESELLSLQIDQLPVGSYNVTLSVSDAAGNTRTTYTTVAVISYMLGGIGTELVMIASGVTLFIFILLIIIIKKVL